MKRLANGLLDEGISIEELKKENNLKDGDISEMEDLFTQLQTGGFIYNRDFISQAIGGSFLLLGFSEMQTSNSRVNNVLRVNRPKVAIFTTLYKFEDILELSQYRRWLDITVVNVNSMLDLLQFDSTERTNATELLGFIDGHKDISSYETVLVILSHPNPILLRNLNRLFIHYNVPWILSSLDGPFVILTSFVPGNTACFECLELRIISQIRSQVEYKSFVSLMTRSSLYKDIEFTPLLQIPIAIAMNELILLSSFKASHFVGRLLSIYVPFFEIQMQDVLQVPICPGCGHISKASMKELYFDFRRFVSDITRKLE